MYSKCILRLNVYCVFRGTKFHGRPNNLKIRENLVSAEISTIEVLKV